MFTGINKSVTLVLPIVILLVHFRYIIHRYKNQDAKCIVIRAVGVFILSNIIRSPELFIIFHRVGTRHAKDTHSRSAYTSRGVNLSLPPLSLSLSLSLSGSALSQCALTVLARILRQVCAYLPTSGCCIYRYVRRATRGM